MGVAACRLDADRGEVGGGIKFASNGDEELACGVAGGKIGDPTSGGGSFDVDLAALADFISSFNFDCKSFSVVSISMKEGRTLGTSATQETQSADNSGGQSGGNSFLNVSISKRYEFMGERSGGRSRTMIS